METSSINNISSIDQSSNIDQPQNGHQTILSFKALKKLTIEAELPFKFAFEPVTDTYLNANKILRIIPKKRIVLLATWNTKKVVAKIFFKIDKAKQELAQYELLKQLNVPVPELLSSHLHEKNKCAVLIYEYLEEVTSALDMLLPQKESVTWFANMRLLILEIATQHVLGLVQEDLHLKNYLFTQDHKIISLDFADIKKCPGPLNKKDSLKHLALLFAQLGAVKEDLYVKLFKLYAASRGWMLDKGEFPYLLSQIKQCKSERKKAFEKKVFRNCTDFAAIRTSALYAVYDRDYCIQDFLPIEKFFNSADTASHTFAKPNMLKMGRSATILEVTLNNKKFVIKRYNIKNILHRMRRFFRRTRAAQAWRLSQYLRLIGIATPKPVAFIETFRFGIRQASYFVMEKSEGLPLPSYLHHLTEKNSGDGNKAHQHDANVELSSIAAKIIQLLQKLAHMNMTHGDLKMTNIFIQDDEPILLDVDGMRAHGCRHSLQKAYKKDLTRLLQNWQNSSEIRQAFEKAIQSSIANPG